MRVRGSSSARAAASRNFAANIDVAPRRRRASASTCGNALDEGRAVVRPDAGRLFLIAKVLEEVLRGERVEVVLLDEARDGLRARRLANLAHELSDRLAERNGAFCSIRLPERHLPRLPRC